MSAVERSGKGPARNYSWPPFQNGNEAALKHGARSPRKVEPRARELADALAELVPLGSPSDEPMVWMLANQLARCELAWAWLAEHGLLTEQGEPQPVLRSLSTWENSASRLADRLGLTPFGRSQVGLNVAAAAEIVKRHERDLSALSAQELAQLHALLSKTENGGVVADD
jgi:phage terminase small subunit